MHIHVVSTTGVADDAEWERSGMRCILCGAQKQKTLNHLRHLTFALVGPTWDIPVIGDAVRMADDWLIRHGWPGVDGEDPNGWGYDDDDLRYCECGHLDIMHDDMNGGATEPCLNCHCDRFREEGE